MFVSDSIVYAVRLDMIIQAPLSLLFNLFPSLA